MADAGAQVSPLLSYPVDSSAAASRGGVLKSVLHSDVNTFDVLSASSTSVHLNIGAYTYPRLMKFKSVKYPAVATGEVEGDLADGLEVSGDRLQLTFRLRQGQKWDARAPTSGRQIDAEDVLFSWNKFARGPLKDELIYHADTAPGAPVESVHTPDPRTLVIKLKQPVSTVLSQMAFDRLFYVMPRESDGRFDPRTEARGYGPWLMADNRTGSSRTWLRNPSYYLPERPLPDAIDMPVIPEYRARQAQFMAGDIWTHVLAQEDLLDARRQLPRTLLRQGDSYATASGSLGFGYASGSPWRDERMRQAVSLLLDRDTFVHFGALPRFQAEGLPLDVRLHTVVAAGWEGFWTDPASAEFGWEGSYYRFDPTEARRLIAAAGFENGVDTMLHYNGGSQYGSAYARTAELLSGMLGQAGIRAQLDPREYAADWLPNYYHGHASAHHAGKQTSGFKGIIYRPPTSQGSAVAQLFTQYHRDGLRFEGMTPDGGDARNGDPQVNEALSRIRTEPDTKRQQDQVRELARQMAARAYSIPVQPHSALGFSLSWPVIGNLGAFRSGPAGSPVTETAIHHWIDSSQPPLGAPA